MATDLPKRPEPDPDEAHRIVKPTERVKSVADKTDPRFEAAKARIERQDKIMARQEPRSASGARSGSHDGDDGQPKDEEPEKDGKGSFSFNMTAGDAKDQH